MTQLTEVNQTTTESIDKNWQFYLGIVFLGYSLVTFPLAALVPLLPLSTAQIASVATGIVISGEIGFWCSAALLGKPFVKAVKTKVVEFFKRLLRKKPEVEIRPISRLRHSFGLVLFFSSFVPYYIVGAIPFFNLSHQRELTLIVGILISGEVLFYISLLVLGDEFWARLKRLFEWPGDTTTS